MMKSYIVKYSLITGFFLLISYFSTYAQQKAPRGFFKGSVTLFDSTIWEGFVRDDIKNHGSVITLDKKNKKKTFTGYLLISASIDTMRYLCIDGDFFRVIKTGNVGFLQKKSDVAGKFIDNGNGPFFLKGTTGKINDYFFYNNNQKKLFLITKENYKNTLMTVFSICPDILDKINSILFSITDIAELTDRYNTNCVGQQY